MAWNPFQWYDMSEAHFRLLALSHTPMPVIPCAARIAETSTQRERTCAQGFKKLGFSREGSTTVYREWAPAAGSAQLIGDFNNWNGSWMERDEFGVWKITLPDGARAASHQPLLSASRPMQPHD